MNFKLTDWRKQNTQTKKLIIKANGKDLSWNAMQESLEYIDPENRPSDKTASGRVEQK